MTQSYNYPRNLYIRVKVLYCPKKGPSYEKEHYIIHFTGGSTSLQHESEATNRKVICVARQGYNNYGDAAYIEDVKIVEGPFHSTECEHTYNYETGNFEGTECYCLRRMHDEYLAKITEQLGHFPTYPIVGPKNDGITDWSSQCKPT